ncbi:DNA ligase 6-like [Carica papaya]|uniref:DNA ligase 6-like n=1 Tax=Carica papaya TaxID=3649 RepID=UPI000B8C7C64|nr:DNA ligase 6-like [Carica papaya]
MAVLRVLGYGESEIFTKDERESDVHVVGWNVLGETWPYFRPNFVRMKDIMVEKGYEKVVGFVPTGWTYEVKRNKFAVRCKDSYEIHLVPYSEHSNYDELREYVKYLKPKRAIPTVGMDAENIDSKHAIKMRKHFVVLVDEMTNKKDFLMGFYLRSCEHGEKAEMNASIGLNEPDQEKGNSSEAPTIEKNDPGDTLDDTILSVEPSLRVSTLQVNDEETEKIIGELRDCLPTWLTQEQILDLIRKSGRNIVVVSNFYEQVTEFYQQVFACTTSGSASQTSLLNDTVPLSKQAFVENSPHKSVGIHLSQVCKSSNIKTSVKSSISPGKERILLTISQTKK